jgi:hypothetical protein
MIKIGSLYHIKYETFQMDSSVAAGARRLSDPSANVEKIIEIVGAAGYRNFRSNTPPPPEQYWYRVIAQSYCTESRELIINSIEGVIAGYRLRSEISRLDLPMYISWRCTSRFQELISGINGVDK